MNAFDANFYLVLVVVVMGISLCTVLLLWFVELARASSMARRIAELEAQVIEGEIEKARDTIRKLHRELEERKRAERMGVATSG